MKSALRSATERGSWSRQARAASKVRAHLPTKILSRLRALHNENSTKVITTELHLILSEVLQYAAHSSKLEMALGNLMRSMWGAEIRLASLSRLYYRIEQAQGGRLDLPAVILLLEHTEQWMQWYFRRRAILDLLEYEAQERDYLLPLSINEHGSVCGAPGIELVAAVKLLHHAGQQRYATLEIRDEGRPLERETSWLAQVGLEFSSRSALGRVSAVVPLNATASREVFDDVRLGIPWAALALEPGWHNLDIILRITDEFGESFSERHEGRVVYVGPSSELEPLSPQLRGIWEHHAASGSEIAAINAYRSREDEFTVSCALTLASGSLEPVQLRCIPRSREGFDLIADTTSRALIARSVDLIEPIEQLGTFTWKFPREVLQLDGSGGEILFDIAALGEQGRPIIGALRALRFTIF